uniref:DNA topoisomerase n=1 Tax=Kwoniella pini CBS 10737 TaxID=1296096 RepID=A0A1B9HVK7_9TREE|nr:DNA topoisomerase III [Kwoniella pini CBS 10737]OCF47291.1 DNA topoisomerase III [Kwoniella pini CBS 10737]
MKVLCVAEKPSIAKSITEILSGGRWDTRNSPHQYIRNYDFDYNLPPPLGRGRSTPFTVTAVLGHLMSIDFGEDHRKWHSCDPFSLFDAPILTSVSKDLKKVEQNLINEARHSEILMIWTDCDREGEHIGSEVASVCRKVNRNIIVKRARFSAIIAAQIHQAARQANDLDQRQADAVEARMALDLRIGAVFTRFMTMGLQVRIPELAEQLVSYGPCQFPTLGFVVDQYNRVQSFVPETFWYIYVGIERTDEEGQPRTVEFKWRRNHLFDMDIAAILYEQCAINPDAMVLKVETKPTTKWYPLPLTTVELQQSGSRLLRMAPKRVLDIAEKLYQKGILSYPRTETDQYDKAFDFNSLIQKQTHDNQWGQYAQKLVDGAYQRPRNGKKNDKAHPPIHPTAHAGNLDGDERRVFELVTRRFLASCSKNAEGKTTTVEINIADELFHTSGLVITQRNYLEVYPYDKWSDSAVPDFQEGEMFTPTIIELKEGSTSKPNLLTEADLVGLMDRNGIGTDATIAEHIAKIIERQYVTEKQEQKVKYLLPSQLGVGLIEGYNKIDFDRSLSKPHLRRETEHRMQLVCDGLKVKREILNQTIDEYKEVFIKAKRDFEIVIESVNEYLHGRGEAQEALRAATQARRGRAGAAGAARGGRGGRGGGAGVARRGRPDNDNDDDDDDDSNPGLPRGGGRTRASVTSTRGTSTRGRGARGGAANAGVAGTARKRNYDNGEGSVTGVKTCDCDLPAVSRTVQKADSPHVGRQFWTCSKPQNEQCGYFEWANEGESISHPGNSAGQSAERGLPPSKRQRPSSRNETRGNDEDVRCKCDLEAKLVTVNKEGPNKGKQFWACPNNPKASCKFFQWAEEGNPGTQAGPKCFKCGQVGHWSNSCPNDSAGGGGAGGSGTGEQSGECFKCGQSGHWSNSCPNDGLGGSAAPNGRGRSGSRARGKSRGRARGR